MTGFCRIGWHFGFWKTKCLFRQEKGLTLAYSTSSKKNYSPTPKRTCDYYLGYSDKMSDIQIKSFVCSLPTLSVDVTLRNNYVTFRVHSKNPLFQNLVHVKLIYFNENRTPRPSLWIPLFFEPNSSSPIKRCFTCTNVYIFCCRTGQSSQSNCTHVLLPNVFSFRIFCNST